MREDEEGVLLALDQADNSMSAGEVADTLDLGREALLTAVRSLRVRELLDDTEVAGPASGGVKWRLESLRLTVSGRQAAKKLV